jgi:hypothetical protein
MPTVSDPSVAVAIWSAIAASFAAVVAFLAWTAQVRSLRESFRPEVVLYGWARSTSAETGSDTISFAGIKNVGRGSARPVVINAFALADDERPIYTMSTINLPSLSPNETVDQRAQISIEWNNVPRKMDSSKSLGITITAYYWDALNVRHITTFGLLAVQDPSRTVVSNSVARGLALGTVSTRSTPVWRLKLHRQLPRLPILGRAFREKVAVMDFPRQTPVTDRSVKCAKS